MADDDPAPDFSDAPPVVDTPGPDFTGVTIDPKDPESRGFSESFSNIYAPSFYKGLIDAGTFLFDIPTQVLGSATGTVAEALGFDEFGRDLKNPVLLSDIVKKGFEAPARIEEAITGEPATVTSGFDATPRAAQSQKERFYRDLAYISGGGLSFPTSLAAGFNVLRAPAKKLLDDAAGRTTNSEAARKLVDQAFKNKGPNVAQALKDASQQYANKFVRGLATKPTRTIATEQGFATAAGIGYAIPEMFADEDGRIMLDLKDGAGSFDAAPTLKILASMGLPIALAHGPTGVVLGGDAGKVGELIKYVRDKAKVISRSLIGGFTEQGRMDMAARIINTLESEPGFLEKVFLPAVESGQFVSPGSSTPIKIADDGTVIPEFGGLRPDTLQALRQLGYDDPRLAALDQSLRDKGTTLKARVSEEARRAEQLDKTFELLRSHLGAGDEAVTFNALEQARNNLDQQALESFETAVRRARDFFEAMEPSIGRAEASKLAVEMIEGARTASKEVTRKLFDKELIGTETVDTRSLGDFAIRVITELGERNIPILPEMGIFYKLAGKNRLEEAGLLPSGKPITDKDLKGAKGDGDELLTADEIPDQGLYDVFGEPGTIYAEPVRIETVQNFRSEIGDKVRAAYKAGNEKVGKRLSRIIDFIDDEILAAKNFEGQVAPENLQNIEIARGYVKSAKERFGPNSKIGKELFKGDPNIDEGFLTRLLRPGPEAGARVELFRNALNEPQSVVQDGKVTWQKNPAASLTVSDNPNVIEADLLLRFTEGLGGGVVTQKYVDRFLTQYKDAVDKISGLREKFNDLKSLQQAADEMTHKLTVPDRNKVLSAIREGATLEDINTAKQLLRNNLNDRQLANTASDYLDADVNQAARRFLESSVEKGVAAGRADEIAALLAKDETGSAAAGFRAALWRVLRDNSRRTNPDGQPQPGLNTQQLTQDIEKYRPFLEKFYDKASMEFLDELVKGGPLQRTGTDAPFAGSPQAVMRAEFGTTEAVGAAGRTIGQKFFGIFGINPLVATGMGRRIAAYTFTNLGEAQILKNVEDALRDPEKAANLIRRYKKLKDVDEEALSPVRDFAEEALADPTAVITGKTSTAKDKLKDAAGFATKYLKNHSSNAIKRAVRYGLIPAQGEFRRKTLEEDYLSGPPFDYEDNRIRYEIETEEQDVSSAQPVAPPTRRIASASPPLRAPAAASALSQVSPVAPAPMAQAPQAPQQTMARLEQLGLPLFAKDGGIMTIKKRTRQIVG